MWQRRTIIFAVVVSVSLATAASAQGQGRIGMGMMGMGRDSATMAQMRVIHELVVNNARIERTVTNLPNGIRTVTTSADPALARLIKDHVLTMDQRVTRGNDPRLPMESDALRAIFRGKDKVRTVIDTTAAGIIVVQTFERFIDRCGATAARRRGLGSREARHAGNARGNDEEHARRRASSVRTA